MQITVSTVIRIVQELYNCYDCKIDRAVRMKMIKAGTITRTKAATIVFVQFNLSRTGKRILNQEHYLIKITDS